MATLEEIIALARRLISGEWQPGDGWPDSFADHEQRGVLALGEYERHRRRARHNPHQRKAMRLLMAWLPATAREELRRSRHSFSVVGSAGGTYRLYPRVGMTERVERHGRYFYRVGTFCYHDPECELPSADITLAHAMLIQTDEPAFLASANETRRELLMWDRTYMRHMREIRLARLAGHDPNLQPDADRRVDRSVMFVHVCHIDESAPIDLEDSPAVMDMPEDRDLRPNLVHALTE